MLIGYTRVSAHDQTLNLQQDALTKAGCSKIFTDTASGAKAERIGLEEALSYVRKGDTLVVWRLDRLGRSLPHLIATMTDLEERWIGFKSLTENIDTTTSGGKLIFHIFGALAEFERNLIRERTTAGLMAARARGRSGGRPKAFTGKKLTIAQDLYDKRHSILEICRTLKVSKATLYRSLKTRERYQPPLTRLVRHVNGRPKFEYDVKSPL
jgi:DNA invertase Pin-like site-specific DNA recombinase